MGSKFLVGAVVAAFSVWGGVWKLADRGTQTVVLAAQDSAEPRRATAIELLDVPRDLRAEAIEPDPPEAVVLVTEPVPLTPGEIAKLIEDLRNDDTKYNAMNALWDLIQAGPDALPPLQRALLSDDWQQRMLAGYVLGSRTDAPATPILADVLAEGLGEDSTEAAATKRPWVDVASGCSLEKGCCEVLAGRPALFALARSRLAPLIQANDPLLRVRTAFLFATHRSELVRLPVFATLIDALEDNDVDGDARYALRGLVRLCASSTEALERAWPGRDDQQRALIGHLLSRFAPQHPGGHMLSMREFSQLGFSQGDPLLIEKYELEL